MQAPRARALFGDCARITYKNHGRFASTFELAKAIRRQREGWIYCIDLGIPGAPLCAVLRRASAKLIFELGDPAGPLLANQSRPRWEIAVAAWLDSVLSTKADGLTFRGTYLKDYFERLVDPRLLPPSEWLPDGVDTDLFRPLRGTAQVQTLRERWGLDDEFVVGIVGSINHSPAHDLFYGWEIAEALVLIPERERICSVVVGDGPGMHRLRERVRELKLERRMKLVGRVPHQDIPLWVNVFDVALSTQTDDPVGWGRTTAKLPEYLACGAVVVCTDVGEAHRLLKPSGQTLPYKGMRDPGYPEVLAARLQELRRKDLSSIREANRQLALSTFDYRTLRERAGRFIATLDPHSAEARAEPR